MNWDQGFWLGMTTLVFITVSAKAWDFRSRGLRVRFWAAVASQVGACCNAAVVLSNGLHMPVRDWHNAIRDGLHAYETSSSHLMLLADIFRIGEFARYSLGDVFIVTGAVVWVLNWVFSRD